MNTHGVHKMYADDVCVSVPDNNTPHTGTATSGRGGTTRVVGVADGGRDDVYSWVYGGKAGWCWLGSRVCGCAK